MAVTIKDVAKKAGVSPSTVSRVISDDKSISDKTKIKVRAVMEDLKYYPNMNARRLVSNRSNVVGLVLPNNTDAFYQNPFFPTVLRGINEVSVKANYSLLLYTGNSDDERLDHVKQMVFGKQVDGLLLLYSKKNDQIVSFLKDIAFPFVVVGSPIDKNINAVDNDNELLAREATNYLLTLGARKIAFVGGDETQDFVQLRFAGYKAAIESFGIGVQDSLIFNDVTFLRSSGYEISRQLSQIANLDGIIIADQLVARGIKDGWQQFKQKNIPMVTFKAYDSRESADSKDIFVNINAQQLGQHAVEMLLADIAADNDSPEKQYSQIIVEGTLIK